MPRRGGVTRFTKRHVSISGVNGIVANLVGGREVALERIRGVTLRNGGRTLELAQKLCRVRTGRMRGSLRLRFSQQGLVFEVYYDRSVFTDEGVPYYPPYVELGTRFMRAQPALGPAYAQVAPDYESEIRKAFRDAWRGL